MNSTTRNLTLWIMGQLLLHLSLGSAAPPARAQYLLVSGLDNSAGTYTVNAYDTETAELLWSFPQGGGGRLAWGPDRGDGGDDLYAIKPDDGVDVFGGPCGDWQDLFIRPLMTGFADLVYHEDFWYVTKPGSNCVIYFDADGVGGVPFVQMTGPPWGVAVSPEDDTLLVTSPEEGEVYEFYFNTQLRRKLGAGNLTEPRGVAIGADGNIYVSDYSADKVVKIDRVTGQVVDPEFITAGSSGLSEPEELVCGPDGRWYVMTSHPNGQSDYAVFEYDSAGNFLRALVPWTEMCHVGGLEVTRYDADLDGDGDTDQADLAILLANWGCACGNCPGDIDGDGATGHADLGILLVYWGCGT